MEVSITPMLQSLACLPRLVGRSGLAAHLLGNGLVELVQLLALSAGEGAVVGMLLRQWPRMGRLAQLQVHC